MAADHPLRYKIASTTEQLCGLLGIDPVAVLRRMQFPEDYLKTEGRGVTPQDFFAGWQAIVAETGRDDTPLMLGQAYARGPFNPAFFAFTCSPTVAVGLARLALFKPLTGPLHLSLRRDEMRNLHLTKSANVPGLALPASFAATELVFLIEAIRTCTAHKVVPLSATITGPVACLPEIEAFLGCKVDIALRSGLILEAADADRVLLSRNADYWAQIEPSFRRQMVLQREGSTLTARVGAVLRDMLPAGEASVHAAAERLRLSARTLQRYLKEEGTTFQSELDRTREALARQYLTSTDLNVEEISFLLAYRDPNSFYRAFQAWTGQTPRALRSSAT